MKKMLKSKRVLFLMAVECLLFLILLPGVWEKQMPYTIEDQAMIGLVGETAVTKLPALKAGIYEITVEYQADAGSNSVIGITNDNNIYKSTYSNDIELPGGETVKVMTVWLTTASEYVNLHLMPGENANLVVDKIQVVRTNAGTAVALVCLFLLCMVVNGCCLYGHILRISSDSAERKMIAWGLFGILMVASLPIFTDYCLNGTELNFQLLRIEELKKAFLSGQFPVQVQAVLLNGQVTIYEGNLFLLIPALFRIVGFPVQTAYRFHLLSINLITVWLAYICFKRIFDDRVIGLVCCMLYVWMPYRLDALYGNAELGEVTAICFLPVVFYGFLQVLMNTEEEKRYKDVWVLSAAGLTCMLQAHMTSFLLTTGMIFLIYLFCWKRVCTKRILYNIGKILLTVLVLNGWTLISVLDSLRKGQLSIKYIGSMPIQSKGGSVLHYLMTFYRDGASRDFSEDLLVNTAPLGIGFAVTCLLFLFIWILFTGHYRMQCRTEAIWKIAIVSAGVGSILMFMSTSTFPWNKLRSESRVVQLITVGIKSPMELVPLVAICLIFAGSVVLWQIGRQEKKEVTILVLVVVVAVAFVTTQYLTGDIVSNREAVRVYDGQALYNMQLLSSSIFSTDL